MLLIELRKLTQAFITLLVEVIDLAVGWVNSACLPKAADNPVLFELDTGK